MLTNRSLNNRVFIYRLPRVFACLVLLSLLPVWRSEAQTITSPELFEVYQSFPPINGTVHSRDPDAVTITIRRGDEIWDGSGWVNTEKTSTASANSKTRLATRVVGNQWWYDGALPKEDGIYDISVTVHSGNSGHGTGIEIRVDSGQGTPATTVSTGSVFKPALKIGAGNKMRAMAIADFNGDQKPDMVVGSHTNRVSILLGDGAGGFATAGNFAVGAPAFFIVAGDFNNDDQADFAVSHANTNSVSLLLGDGRGGFDAPTTIPVGDDPLGMVAHDFNQDGNLDLATANYGTRVNQDTVSILWGEGTGRFQAAQRVGVGSGPVFVAVSDFNGDGKADLATANSHSASVSILLGNGSGFKPQPEVKVGMEPHSLATGDFNGDGNVDIATTNGHRWSNRQHTLSILMGNGRGGFQSKTHVLDGMQPQTIVSADFDGDGHLDLCIADSPMHRLILLPNNGKGEFWPPVAFGVGSNPMLQTVSDFNADGKPDIAVVTYTSISILLHNSPPPASPASQNQMVKEEG